MEPSAIHHARMEQKELAQSAGVTVLKACHNVVPSVWLQETNATIMLLMLQKTHSRLPEERQETIMILTQLSKTHLVQ